MADKMDWIGDILAEREQEFCLRRERLRSGAAPRRCVTVAEQVDRPHVIAIFESCRERAPLTVATDRTVNEENAFPLTVFGVIDS